MDGYWILLGMMGAGKSTVGRSLAALLEVPFSDTDSLLERRFGRQVSSIFRIYGEDTFRQHETSILEAIDRQPGVLATGGGLVVREQNWEQFQRLGITVFLDVPPTQLKERLAKSKKRRPLLEHEDWQQRFDCLYEARLGMYSRADIRFPVDAEHLESCAQQLFETLQARAS